MKTFSQGDIVWIDCNPQVRHEQAGRRPALVMSNSKYNATGSLAMVCPITNTKTRRVIRPELPAEMETTGCVLCDHSRFVDIQARNAEYIESAPDELVQATRDILHLLIAPN